MKEKKIIQDYFNLLYDAGAICQNDSVPMPSLEDAKPAYFEAASKLGLRIHKFEIIKGEWEKVNIIYRMEVAVEGMINAKFCSHIESIRFHRTGNGWDIELPIFSLCGVRKKDINIEPLASYIKFKRR